MSYRKALISLSLLLLVGSFAAAQDQSSPTQNSQSPNSSAPASTTKVQTNSTAQTPPAQPSSTQSPSTQPGSASAPPPPDTSHPSSDDSSDSSAKDANVPANPPVVQEPDDSKVKHDGGEDDVDAIGNRKVGGRGLGDWYSLETEIKIGKQYAMQVDNSVKLVTDPVVTEYVNRIGQNLVRNSDAQGAIHDQGHRLG